MATYEQLALWPDDDAGEPTSTQNLGVWALNRRSYEITKILPPDRLVIMDEWGNEWAVKVEPYRDYLE